MKERYAIVRRTYPESHALVDGGRWCRLIGRVCLLGAAAASGVEIFYAWRGVPLSPVTLRSMLDLSSAPMAWAIAPLRAATELAVDAPLWVVLIVLAALPYALAIQRFLRATVRRDRARSAVGNIKNTDAALIEPSVLF
jgi:hypothetical protein